MTSVIVIMLVVTMTTAGQQYERTIPMSSIAECLSQAAEVLNEAAKVHVDMATDAAEIGAGCVVKVNPGQPA
jgi:hypothetical protein